ncbi:indolepyruvate ferredoxin oxidoreductase family protein [Azospirillum canadense]|uniref:indolepyruvate ferredoxin oxidoreductase family protein n=1 Tax=Azospirillum canadense TaxID=403962 RepID=UPI002227D212|nr:indolepyruvate ferredoxin oxidoreductase family protein [Azospirillum canadense]MCW2240495.1 indolepyruvate ferredoxin oxidoreductase [Azospirillum canadense]
MPEEALTLDDKYVAENGRIFVNGTQALVRLALEQAKRDRGAGLCTSGFITGYRGSPLGNLDLELTKHRSMIEARNITFQPGVNEDLAATALWGTQQIHLFEKPLVDGVFGLWYGKGPGVDRTGDAFRHANLAGTSPTGGVLVLAGDDHTCKSSTTSHQSEYALVDAMIPILAPSTVDELIEYGLHGWKLSRYSGCWAAMKVTADHTDRTVSLQLDSAPPPIVLPTDHELPPGGLGIRWPDTPQEQEARLHLHKIPAVRAYLRANRLDRTVFAATRARLGIVTVGKSHLDVMAALALLGIDRERAAVLGLSVYKIACPWPLEPEGVRAFASGLEEVLVVEEKRPLVETQLKDILFNQPAAMRPRIVGKDDEDGLPQLRSHDELSAEDIALTILRRLERLGEPVDLGDALPYLSRATTASSPKSGPKRSPYFCSGCPHSSSTKVPEGSRALAGIGCHFMSQMMDRNTATYAQMGGEGASWIGQARYVPTKHVFQNIGDGTYFHSGLLAIRAAVASRVNITYKILFNDAVAMTGGQRHDGTLSPQTIAWQVRAEGVNRIAVVTDEPEKYGPSPGFPPYVSIHHRDEMDAVQRELRDVSGVSAIVYDQTCAAEKRRRRKRKLMADPPKRLMINERVCEGCGDCSIASNCLSVVPVETEFGTKRQIDQSSCNKDFSCQNGFCPSFVTVQDAVPRKRRPVGGRDAIDTADLPVPERPALESAYGILVTGVGGTGVVTIGAIIGMAAHIEGLACSVLDQTGMAQKGGAVTSHIRLARAADQIHAPRLGAGAAALLLGCDLLVAAGDDCLARIRPEKTRAVLNTHEAITGDFTRDPSKRLNLRQLAARVVAACGDASAVEQIDATAIATALLGDSIAANLFLLGFAWQKGLIPLTAESIERAIELNGAAVAMNRAAFAWGRRAAVDRCGVEAAAAGGPVPVNIPDHRRLSESLDELIRRRGAQLAAYQDEAYSARYHETVERVRQAMARVRSGDRFTEAVAKGLYKLMAYKDEYEVARLYTDGAFLEQLREQFEDGHRIRFNLAPPLMARKDPVTGHLIKREYGPWVFTAFKLLARLKGLRGTALDPFGWTEERRMERRLICEYETMIGEILTSVDEDTLNQAVALANLPEGIRGYGHVKEKSVAEAKHLERKLREQFRAGAKAALPAE